MDPRARDALETFVRSTVARDLDQVVGELALMRQELGELGELRRQVQALRQAVGLDPSSRSERRELVLTLRQEGHSERAIAAQLGTNRRTITRDLRELRAPRPPLIAGLDGRLTRGPGPPSVA